MVTLNRQELIAVIAVFSLAVLGNKCAGGDGMSGDPPTLRIERGKCASIPGTFPPGFDWLPGGAGHAVATLDAPPAALFLDMNADQPELLEQDEIESVPPDSDGDGENDEDQRLCADDMASKTASLGDPLGVDDRFAFVASSGFEQVMFFRAPNGRLVDFEVTNPPNPPSGSYHGEDYPYLPADTDERSAISTKACIYLPPDTGLPDETSTGDAIGQHPCCEREPGVPSFMTAFTAGMARAAGHLFVATSNLDLPRSFRGSYFPGTVLVYDYDPAVDRRAIKPSTDVPVIFTSGFNPTGMASYTTPRGRELVLVTNSGALVVGVGSSNIKSDAYIDVIDAASQRLVATIAMGRAGLAFEGLAIDPSKRVGLIGSWTLRLLYGIDLRVFDDEDLYAQSDVVALDGSDPHFPDARIFDADFPFEIPDRNNGPHPLLCEGWTYVAINEAGESAQVLERCDGTLTEVHLLEPTQSCVEAGDTDECCDQVPLPESCFEIGVIRNVTDPCNAIVEPHGPSQIAIRPGEPGIDYSGPDTFFLVDLPEGQLCALRVDSF